MNSIVQPAVATPSPVVGLAITAESAVAGSATGASSVVVIDQAVRFAVELAKDFTRGNAHLVDEAEFSRLIKIYGSMHRLQRASAA
nr:DUF1177 family protein [Leucobacter insecticola]